MKCTIVFSTIIINFWLISIVFGCPFGWQPVISKGAMISCSYHQKICESLNVVAPSQCKQARWAVSESLVCCTVDIRDAASLLSVSASSSKTNVFLPIPSVKSTEMKFFPTTMTPPTTITTPSTIITTPPSTITTTPPSTITTTPSTIATTSSTIVTTPSMTATPIAVQIIEQQTTFSTSRTSSTISVYNNVWTHRQVETYPIIKNHLEPSSSLSVAAASDSQNNNQLPNAFNVGTELLHVGAELVHVGSEILSINRLKTVETTERTNALIENENFNVQTLLLPRKNVGRDNDDDFEEQNSRGPLLLPSKTTTVGNIRPIAESTPPSVGQINNLNSHAINLFKHGEMMRNNFNSQFGQPTAVVDSSSKNFHSNLGVNPPPNNIHSIVSVEDVRSKIFVPNVYSPYTETTTTRSDIDSPNFPSTDGESVNNLVIDEYSKISTPDTTSNVNVTQFYILPDGVTQVIQLIEGKKMELLGTKLLQKRAFTSVTLLRTPRKNILVDAGWPMDKYLLVDVLWNKMKIKASTDIHHVVITKDGVDTMGAVSDFASADVITPHVYIKRNHAWKHPAVAGRSWYLDDGVVITPTSGIYGREISVLVKNAVGYGRVAIVGRLFMQPNGGIGEFLSIPRGAFERRTKNRKKIICNVDYVIPIYDKMFKITKAMQKRFECPIIKKIL